VPQKYCWNGIHVFETHQKWEQGYKEIESLLVKTSEYKGKLGKSSEILVRWLNFSAKFQQLYGMLQVYATMDYSTNMQNQNAAGRFFRARSLLSKVQTALAFSEPEIIAIGEHQVMIWLAENPDLRIYEHYFNKIFSLQDHLKSPEIEGILGQVLDPFRTAATIHSTLSDSDLKFRNAIDMFDKEFEITQSSINALLVHSDRLVRKTAWENYADGYLAVKNSLAGCLAAGVKQNVFIANVRGYSSSLEAALKPNKIPVSVFYNLLDVFNRRLPVWHRYWRLRKKILAYHELHVYDIKAPLAAIPPQLEFEESVDYICNGLMPLGDEYVTTLRRGVLEEGWVDSFPNRGKRSGAFSSGSPGTHPYIMMSYNRDIYSLSTLAHELGHSMHSYLSWKNQPFVYGKYSLFVAEVASNFNQAMVRDYLLNTIDDPNFRIAVLEEAMSNYYRYLFIMPTLARFEMAIHDHVEANQALTADYLISLMASLFEEGFGGEMDVDSDRVGITWAQFPNHLYANFYVYQYATGIAGAAALSDKILSGGSSAVDRYLNFLKTGGSKDPLDALTVAGVDLTNPEPIQKAFDRLDDTITQLEKIFSPM
jgi:oligoendopeptidase F